MILLISAHGEVILLSLLIRSDILLKLPSILHHILFELLLLFAKGDKARQRKLSRLALLNNKVLDDCALIA